MKNIDGIIAAFLVAIAVFAWASRRKLLRPGEILLLGIFLGFAGISWIFVAITAVMATVFKGATAKVLGTSAALAVPLIVAYGFGLRGLYRRARADEASPPPADTATSQPVRPSDRSGGKRKKRTRR